MLRRKLSFLGPEKLIAFTLVTELGKTLSDGPNMRRYESGLTGGKGLKKQLGEEEALG